jgi:hypothetical protein
MGREPAVRIRLDGFEGICRMVEQGAGVAIIPESAATRYATFMDFKICSVEEDWARRELYVCSRSAEQLPEYALKLLVVSKITPNASPQHKSKPAMLIDFLNRHQRFDDSQARLQGSSA